MTRVGRVMHAALRDEWDGLERITRDIRVADVFTLLNAFTGAAAMLLAGAGRHVLAVQAILLGVLFDGLDGIVARLGTRWGGGPLGPPLDSLADAVTFTAAPAVLIAAWAGGLDAPWWLLGAATLYAASGLLRLARFEHLRSDAPTRYFSGLPTPAAAATVAALVLIGPPSWAAAVVVAGSGLLMSSRVRYPKLRGAWGILAALVVLALIIMAGSTWGPAAALGLLVFMLVFFVAGPFYVLRRFGPTPHPEVPL